MDGQQTTKQQSAQHRRGVAAQSGRTIFALLLTAVTGCTHLPASGIYLHAGIRATDRGAQIERTNTTLVTREHNGLVQFVGQDVSRSTSNDSTNPYGVLVAGYDLSLSPQWSCSVELGHISSLDSKSDRGTNFVGASVRFRPWGAR
jgi:hypothetical protein